MDEQEIDIDLETMKRIIADDFHEMRERHEKYKDNSLGVPLPHLSAAAFVAIKTEARELGAFSYDTIANDESKSPALRDFGRQMLAYYARVKEELKKRPIAHSNDTAAVMLFGQELCAHRLTCCLRPRSDVQLLDFVTFLSKKDVQVQDVFVRQLLPLLEEHDTVIEKIRALVELRALKTAIGVV